jgi:hypothetical protein
LTDEKPPEPEKSDPAIVAGDPPPPGRSVMPHMSWYRLDDWNEALFVATPRGINPAQLSALYYQNPATDQPEESQPASQSAQAPAEPTSSVALSGFTSIRTFGNATAKEPESDSDVPDVESIPSQVATASQFTLNAEGRVDLVPDPPIADGSQREIYSEVRHKALKRSATTNSLISPNPSIDF